MESKLVVEIDESYTFMQILDVLLTLKMYNVSHIVIFTPKLSSKDSNFFGNLGTVAEFKLLCTLCNNHEIKVLVSDICNQYTRSHSIADNRKIMDIDTFLKITSQPKNEVVKIFSNGPELVQVPLVSVIEQSQEKSSPEKSSPEKISSEKEVTATVPSIPAPPVANEEKRSIFSLPTFGFTSSSTPSPAEVNIITKEVVAKTLINEVVEVVEPIVTEKKGLFSSFNSFFKKNNVKPPVLAPVPTGKIPEVTAEVPAEVPVRETAKVSTELPAEVAAEVAAEVPAELPTEVPVRETTEVPAEVPSSRDIGEENCSPLVIKKEIIDDVEFETTVADLPMSLEQLVKKATNKSSKSLFCNSKEIHDFESMKVYLNILKIIGVSGLSLRKSNEYLRERLGGLFDIIVVDDKEIDIKFNKLVNSLFNRQLDLGDFKDPNKDGFEFAQIDVENDINQNIFYLLYNKRYPYIVDSVQNNSESFLSNSSLSKIEMNTLAGLEDDNEAINLLQIRQLIKTNIKLINRENEVIYLNNNVIIYKLCSSAFMCLNLNKEEQNIEFKKSKLQGGEYTLAIKTIDNYNNIIVKETTVISLPPMKTLVYTL